MKKIFSIVILSFILIVFMKNAYAKEIPNKNISNTKYAISLLDKKLLTHF